MPAAACSRASTGGQRSRHARIAAARRRPGSPPQRTEGANRRPRAEDHPGDIPG
ncbi:hypothetical protein DVS28_a1136 [Euzebya pacifica]|uniref:Uncharacterized protein n=1 Tax=Euzebya pacifica TaxID=1608957 RepID=A0A346XUD9_9ACTN|nr:hypothetical protein DVS28_a1136 [Euzebya pacifica]